VTASSATPKPKRTGKWTASPHSRILRTRPQASPTSSSGSAGRSSRRSFPSATTPSPTAVSTPASSAHPSRSISDSPTSKAPAVRSSCCRAPRSTTRWPASPRKLCTEISPLSDSFVAMASHGIPWYRRPIARWAHLRSIPLSRLWMLLLAAFLLFCILGFYDDLMSYGTLPYAAVFLLAAISGVNAMLWILTLSRLPAVFILGLVALQFFIGRLNATAAHWMTRSFDFQSVPSEKGIHFAASCILICSITSYFFFTTFIRTEGKRSLIIQNELDLAHSIQRTLVPTLEIRTPRFEVYGISQPSEKVGGD